MTTKSRHPNRARMRLSAIALALFSTSFVLSSHTTAGAGTACSTKVGYTTNGVGYRNWACINTNHTLNHQAYAVTLAEVTSGTAQSGWAGARPYRFDSTNSVLQCAGVWTYNSAPLGVGGYINPSGCFINVHAAYATHGVTQAWNGNSYQSWPTLNSPAQTS